MTILLKVASLVIILNILSELEFFRSTSVSLFFPIYLSLLNSPSLIFEMFPFIFLISTQLFFINLFNDNQIQIFKYSGLKNSKILTIITLFSLLRAAYKLKTPIFAPMSQKVEFGVNYMENIDIFPLFIWILFNIYGYILMN